MIGKFYSLEGYPCSEEQFKREIKSMYDAIPKVSFDNKFKIPILYGTGGENFKDISWKESLEKDLSNEELNNLADKSFLNQTVFVTNSRLGYREFYKAIRQLALQQQLKNK